MAKSAEEVKAEVLQLPEEELKAFRAWYERFDEDAWGRQIEDDARQGKLDELAKRALAEHQDGKTRQL